MTRHFTPSQGRGLASQPWRRLRCALRSCTTSVHAHTAFLRAFAASMWKSVGGGRRAGTRQLLKSVLGRWCRESVWPGSEPTEHRSDWLPGPPCSVGLWGLVTETPPLCYVRTDGVILGMWRGPATPGRVSSSSRRPLEYPVYMQLKLSWVLAH